MTNKLPNRTIPLARQIRGGFAIAACICSVWGSLAAQEKSSTENTPSAENPASETSAAEQNTEKTYRQAARTLIEARKRIEGYDSIKADMLETVLLGTRRYQAQGEYLQTRGNKLRLSFEFSIKGADGKPLEASLLQVSNGEVMHSSYQVGSDLQVSRRDVLQILTALEEHPSLGMDQMKARLGLGGLPALLASIQISFRFDVLRNESIQGIDFVLVAGSWHDKLLKKFRPKGAKPDTPLPAHIPDRIHVYFDKESLFPRRLLYLKKIGDGYQPMMTLDFVNVEQNVAVNEDSFVFYSPEGAVSQDITQNIISQIVEAAERGRENLAPPESSPKTDAPNEKSGK
jgi:outer membrane lipoprotein-sorting protein